MWNNGRHRSAHTGGSLQTPVSNSPGPVRSHLSNSSPEQQQLLSDLNHGENEIEKRKIACLDEFEEMRLDLETKRKDIELALQHLRADHEKAMRHLIHEKQELESKRNMLLTSTSSESRLQGSGRSSTLSTSSYVDLTRDDTNTDIKQEQSKLESDHRNGPRIESNAWLDETGCRPQSYSGNILRFESLVPVCNADIPHCRGTTKINDSPYAEDSGIDRERSLHVAAAHPIPETHPTVLRSGSYYFIGRDDHGKSTSTNHHENSGETSHNTIQRK